MKFAINTKMISDHYNLLEKIKMANKAGFNGVEPWVYEASNKCVVEDSVKYCKDYNMSIPSLQSIVGFMELDGGLMNVGNSELEIFEECKKRLEIADLLNAEYMICGVPNNHRGFNVSWEDSVKRYSELNSFCVKNFKCKLTVEFMGQTSLINTYQKCLNFLNDISQKSYMVVDAYHIWKTGGDMDCFKKCNLGDISVMHISNADKNIERKLHRDRDRVLLNEGQINLKLFANTVKQIKYNNFINVGVYNSDKTSQDVKKFLEQTLKDLHQLFL